MIRYLLGLFCALCVGVAYADCRVEIDNDANTVHLPTSAANTNQEYKLFPHEVWYHQEDNGVPTGVAFRSLAYLPPFMRPSNARRLEITSDDAGQNCNIEIDGDTFACVDWKVTYQRRKAPAEWNVRMWARNCS
jgi:hypothetical protein